MLWRPIGPSGPLKTQTKIRAFTVFELDEIPALMELERELGDQGFELVAVSLDDPYGYEALLEPFLDKWFPDFTTFMSMENDMDAMVSVVDPYWNEVLPTSYVVGRDGSMAERIQGGSSAEEFSAVIRPLLDGEAADDAPNSGPM